MSHQPPADIVSFAKAAKAEYKVPTSVSLAQWIIESGWGVHSPGNNPFGMKPRRGMNDPFQNLNTTEFVKGKYIEVPQPFRVFPTVKEAFEAHAQLLATAPVYAAAMAALPDTNKFVTLMAAHYATDPLYASKIFAMIKSQGLNGYD